MKLNRWQTVGWLETSRRRLGLGRWLALSLVVYALALRAESPDYILKAWQTEDGLPQNSVTSIVQIPDGYLWLATFNGLVRFDGARFTVFDDGNSPGLPSSRLTRLDLDREGGLWVISEEGALSRLWAGRFKRFTAQEGLPAACASPCWITAAVSTALGPGGKRVSAWRTLPRGQK